MQANGEIAAQKTETVPFHERKQDRPQPLYLAVLGEPVDNELFGKRHPINGGESRADAQGFRSAHAELPGTD